MKYDEEFVSCIFTELLIDNVDAYKKELSEIMEKLNSFSTEDINKSYYKKMANLMLKMDEKERESVYGFLRITISDTVSSILGAIDGTHFVNGLDKDCVLNYGGIDIQGDLQDIFLEKIEHEISIDG